MSPPPDEWHRHFASSGEEDLIVQHKGPNWPGHGHYLAMDIDTTDSRTIRLAASQSIEPREQ